MKANRALSFALGLGSPLVSVLSRLPVAELAAAADDWLEREMRRPIVRHEWDRLDCRGVAPRTWVLADTGRGHFGPRPPVTGLRPAGSGRARPREAPGAIVTRS